MLKFHRTFVLLPCLAVFFSATAPAYAVMKIKDGSAVRLDYFFQADGKTIVSQDKQEQMRLVVGRGAYPKDFEKQLIGLKPGDKKVINLKPEEAFGPYRPELLKRVSKAQFPPNLSLKEGQLLGGRNGQRAMRVAKILDDSVVLDENHPLAGKTLKYYIQVLDVS